MNLEITHTYSEYEQKLFHHLTNTNQEHMTYFSVQFSKIVYIKLFYFENIK